MKADTREFRISVLGLQLGMFVSRLDRPWMGSGFPLEGVLINSGEELSRLQRLCTFVYVDGNRGCSPDRRFVDFQEDPVIQRARDAEEFEGLRSKRWQLATDFNTELANAQGAHESLETGISEVMRDLKAGGKLDLSRLSEGVDTMIDSITRNPAAFPWLMELRRTGDYGYQHAMGCSVWAATFGRHLGLDKRDLRDLALGGLLLDVGKTRLPKSMLEKRPPMTASEGEVLRSHVTESSRIVLEVPGISDAIYDIVRCHHERHDGSGYPQGLRGTEIPIFARMLGLIDSYDAMTSVRPYAASRSPHQAVMELYQCRDTLFQAELVEQFIATSGIYPTGSLVELTDGTVGVVMSVLTLKRLRPCVMLLLDENKVALSEFRVLDLAEVLEDAQQRPLNIRSGLPRGAFGIDPTELFLD